MAEPPFRFVYGPVPSRRLGRSLGVDLVAFKTCTYDCIYCQLGRTTNRTTRRAEYVDTARVLAEVKAKLSLAPPPDFVSLAGSGEPTLHSGIGEVIDGIKHLTQTPVAVLTNGSLLWKKEVRRALRKADLVMPSLDAGDRGMFQRVNRPHPKIGFEKMVAGLAEFTRGFPGQVWLEVLLVEGFTGNALQADRIAALAERIHPARLQINTVTRPPGEGFARPVPRDRLERLARRFPGSVDLIAEAPPAGRLAVRAAAAEDADILELLARRPCTCEGVAAGLGLHHQAAAKRLESLAGAGAVSVIRKAGKAYYLRRRDAAGAVKTE